MADSPTIIGSSEHWLKADKERTLATLPVMGHSNLADQLNAAIAEFQATAAKHTKEEEEHRQILNLKLAQMQLTKEQYQVKTDLNKFFSKVTEINSLKDADTLESLLKRVEESKLQLTPEEAAKANGLCADGVCRGIITEQRHPHAFQRGTVALQEIGAHLGKDASDVTAADIRNLKNGDPETWKQLNERIQEHLKTDLGKDYVREEIDYDKMTSAMDRIAALKESAAESLGKSAKSVTAQELHAYLDSDPKALDKVNSKLSKESQFHCDKTLHELAHRVSEYELFLQNNPYAKGKADQILAQEAAKAGSSSTPTDAWSKAEAELNTNQPKVTPPAQAPEVKKVEPLKPELTPEARAKQQADALMQEQAEKAKAADQQRIDAIKQRQETLDKAKEQPKAAEPSQDSVPADQVKDQPWTSISPTDLNKTPNSGQSAGIA